MMVRALFKFYPKLPIIGPGRKNGSASNKCHAGYRYYIRRDTLFRGAISGCASGHSLEPACNDSSAGRGRYIAVALVTLQAVSVVRRDVTAQTAVGAALTTALASPVLRATG